MTPFKSQLFGLLLAALTALGCIMYEKLATTFSYITILFFFGAELVLLAVAGSLLYKNDLRQDWLTLAGNPKYLFYAVCYIATGATSLLWYKITRSQGVMTGSVYEIKYIAIMALAYIAVGENKFTFNTAVGVSLAIASVYFISKT